MTERTTGRHRAACRPSTPLTVFGNAVTGTAGRRVLAVAASSGLALTMGASSAAAVPQVDKVSDDQDLTIGVFDPFGDKDKAGAAATVSVDADIEWEFVSAVVSSEAPPPPPPPEPEPAPAPAPAPERPAANTTASRDNERPEPPAQESSSEDSDSPSAAPASSSGSQIVDIARRYIGTPYVHGGASPSGFDCSGFTQYVFAQAGISLPRTTDAQRYAGTVVSAAEAQPGDLVWAPGHVGIYTGNGQHIAARNPGTALHEGPIYMSNPTFIRVG